MNADKTSGRALIGLIFRGTLRQRRLCSAYRKPASDRAFFCYHRSPVLKKLPLRYPFGGLLVLISAAAPGLAAPALPPYFTLPSQVQVNADSVIAEDYGEAEFHLPGRDDPVVQRGRHWHADLTVPGIPEGTTGKAIWTRLKPSLLQGGWAALGEYDNNPFSATLRYQKNGKDVWASLSVFGADDLRLDLVEVGAAALKLTLKPPAATPEKINAESGDFPYLSPLPRSIARSSDREDGPMLVAVGQNTDEQQAVGNGSFKKAYSLPPGISTLLFATVYRDAFTKAGWTIVNQSQGLHQGDAVLTAHYAANGRDLWAYLHMGGDEYMVQVADAGAEDVGKELDRDCHVALYGIHFDFNKATLRDDSDSVLQKVLSLFNARPDLKLEVQGHTDNVGGDDYNRKLSEARANSVVDWLRAKGIAAGRISARGYGMSVPIAGNDSDLGRAKNRRVELKKQGCGKP
jgi:OOP family OmpA-OmpF porin